jgi:hypothetical protein
MRILPVLIAVSGLAFAQGALADDFGPRFSGDVPRAFQDAPADVDGTAETLQEIAPAAGEEAPSKALPEAGSPPETMPVEDDQDAAQDDGDEIAL